MRFSMAIGLVVAAAVVPTAANAQLQFKPVQTAPRALQQFEIEAVHAGVKRGLKDPLSALFENVAAATAGPDKAYVCGFVNAKNSYGGYVGRKPFFGMLVSKGPEAVFMPIAIGGSETDVKVTRHMCRERGLPL